MEAFAKVLDFLAKYSWAVFVIVAFVLFVPDDAAKQFGLETLRQTYLGIWWLALVLSGAL
jgi:hypothetical protein